MDMTRFRELLRRAALPERFKIDRYIEDVPAMLRESYIYEVERRYKHFVDDAETAKHIEQAAKWLVGNYKFGLLLYGKVGNGKTTLSRAIGRLIGLLYESSSYYGKKNVRHVTALELTSIAKENPDTFNDIKTRELLVIDDVGVEPSVIKVWGNEISPFVEVIYHRYDRQLFTIVTSNLDDEELFKRYGPRVADRFAEMFDRIAFENNSYRTK